MTKGAKAFNDVRTTLDTKLNNAYSYLILGTALASTGTDLYQLIRDYSDFTANTSKYAFNKPAVARLQEPSAVRLSEWQGRSAAAFPTRQQGSPPKAHTAR